MRITKEENRKIKEVLMRLDGITPFFDRTGCDYGGCNREPYVIMIHRLIDKYVRACKDHEIGWHGIGWRRL